MTALPFNPFRPSRWEHQRTGRHLIWFTETAETLSGDKSVYVRGSRGSGKTTLLKSVCWDDLANNESLRLQRTLPDFDYIGVYIKFPDHISESLAGSEWGNLYPDAPDPDLELHRFFSLAVELVCADRCFTACHELRLTEQLSISPADELAVVTALWDEFPALALLSGGAAKTFVSAARACRTIVRQMNEACGRGQIRILDDKLPAREPGEMITFLADLLFVSGRLRSNTGDRQVGFKFCLDDCEVLSLPQQKSLNTLVRKSRHPVSWVVSSVGSFYETSDTFILQQPLTDADRRVVTLDTREEYEFKKICQAVLSLRLLFAVSSDVRDNYHGELQDFFPLERRLGYKSVNDLMAAIIRKSTSPIARSVEAAATNLESALRKQSKRIAEKFNAATGELPYYEAYVLLHWRGREDAFSTSFDQSDIERVGECARLFGEASFEAWLRRKQRAALLHFSSKIGFRNLNLSGWSIVVGLADGSVRDFLEIMGEIYEAFGRRQSGLPSPAEALDRFARSRTLLGVPVQSRGIYAASSSYLTGISSRSELDANAVTRLLDGLGTLTALLQSKPDDPTVLGRAERGVFNVRFFRESTSVHAPHEQSPDREIWSIIRQAELAGYIRTINLRIAPGGPIRSPGAAGDPRPRIIGFRLHRRFAPYFGFSYRGAYEAVSLQVEDLWPLCDRLRPADPKVWASQMATKKGKFAVSQLDLPISDETLAE
jgi:hypothetical protein